MPGSVMAYERFAHFATSERKINPFFACDRLCRNGEIDGIPARLASL